MKKKKYYILLNKDKNQIIKIIEKKYNIWTFIFGPLYFLYKKMYFHSLIFFLISIIIVLVCLLIFGPNTTGYNISSIFCQSLIYIYYGIKFPDLYSNHLLKKYPLSHLIEIETKKDLSKLDKAKVFSFLKEKNLI